MSTPSPQQYTAALVKLQKNVEKEAQAAKENLALLLDVKGSPLAIATEAEYADIGAIMKQANDKFKFLDEERKVTVTPLNDEVKRVNDWYRPALDALKGIRSRCEMMMGAWVLAKRREEQRLLAEAEAEAKKVLATAPGAGIKGGEAMAATQALVTQAAAAQTKKIEKVAHRVVWRWKVVDARKLPREFLMPDEKAISAWVKEHGNSSVPAGVEVEEDVGFTVR